MDTTQFSIPVSMLRQYCFCPRIPYFYLFRQISPVEQSWVKNGRIEQDRQEELFKRRNLSRFGIKSSENWKISNNFELNSSNLNLHGICDSVVKTENEVFLLEYKNTESISCNLGAKVQLTAYSMIYEDTFNIRLNRGFIVYGKKAKTFELILDDEIRQKTLLIKDIILKELDSGVMPLSDATENKCCQCEFFNFCSDRF